MRRKILVGISSEIRPKTFKTKVAWGREIHYGEAQLVSALRDAGAAPLIIPIIGQKSYAKTVAHFFDGLVLSGGQDISPSFYGEKFLKIYPTPTRREILGERRRTKAEFALIDAFRRLKKPILGICRGAQALNVAFGGTLYQDIPSQRRKQKILHRDLSLPFKTYHFVRIEKGSRLESILRARKVQVTSGHHQGIKRLGRGLSAVAYSEDNLVEAIEVPGDRWTIAVQFHPEWFLAEKHQRAIFSSFVSECKAGG